MKSILLSCASAVLALAPFAKAALGEDPQAGGGTLTRNEQLREMGYMLYHLSCINVVNGLNFTRDQAVRLRAIALEMQSMGFRRPVPPGAFSEDFGKVREGFLIARETLLAGGTAGPEIQKRVYEARKIETEAITAGLTWDPSRRWGSCARCHSESASPGKRGGDAGKWEGLPPGTEKEKAAAHILGCYEETRAIAAIRALRDASKRIDGILTEEQKAVFASFSCCLLPPAGLQDPVRVGQAAAAPGLVKVLTDARSVPKWSWPLVKKRIVAWSVEQASVVKPGITAPAKAEIAAAVESVLEKARSLSDMEFEMEKDALAAGLKTPGSPAAKNDQLPFMRAFFLMVPGAVEVFDALIGRIDSASADAGRTRDLGREKPASEGG